jgi:hypothetical protein
MSETEARIPVRRARIYSYVNILVKRIVFQNGKE